MFPREWNNGSNRQLEQTFVIYLEIARMETGREGERKKEHAAHVMITLCINVNYVTINFIITILIIYLYY
jgi:hypothetical protein